MGSPVLKRGEIISQDIRDTISKRYRTVTRAINKEFWNSQSDTQHSLYVGSYGRGTAIDTSDLDIIFVGAGVSCNVDGMPSWNALIQNMAKAIDYSRCDTCRHRLESCENTCLLKDDFSTDELLKVPQHVFNKDQELYYRILNESIPAVTADAPLSSAIFDINSGTYYHHEL